VAGQRRIKSGPLWVLAHLGMFQVSGGGAPGRGSYALVIEYFRQRAENGTATTASAMTTHLTASLGTCINRQAMQDGGLPNSNGKAAAATTFCSCSTTWANFGHPDSASTAAVRPMTNSSPVSKLRPGTCYYVSSLTPGVTCDWHHGHARVGSLRPQLRHHPLDR
jgi:hypothetical protein